jgi:hypothetical protein
MSVKASQSKIARQAPKGTAGRLFFLSVSSGEVFSANPDGSDLKVIVSEGRGAVDNAADLARCKSLRRQLPVYRVARPHYWGPALSEPDVRLSPHPAQALQTPR